VTLPGFGFFLKYIQKCDDLPGTWDKCDDFVTSSYYFSGFGLKQTWVWKPEQVLVSGFQVFQFWLGTTLNVSTGTHLPLKCEHSIRIVWVHYRSSNVHKRVCAHIPVYLQCKEFLRYVYHVRTIPSNVRNRVCARFPRYVHVNDSLRNMYCAHILFKRPPQSLCTHS